MKVQYEIFDKVKYESDCRMMGELFPDDNLPTTEEYTEIGTGEVVGLIKLPLFNTNGFLIADDKSGEFIELGAHYCKRIKD